jgi:hypothetical protein
MRSPLCRSFCGPAIRRPTPALQEDAVSPVSEAIGHVPWPRHPANLRSPSAGVVGGESTVAHIVLRMARRGSQVIFKTPLKSLPSADRETEFNGDGDQSDGPGRH